MKKLAEANQLEYWKERMQVIEFLKDLGATPQTDIWVYSNPPTGWYATVGVDDSVYLFASYYGDLSFEPQPVQGFRPSGALIFSPPTTELQVILALKQRSS